MKKNLLIVFAILLTSQASAQENVLLDRAYCKDNPVETDTLVRMQSAR